MSTKLDRLLDSIHPHRTLDVVDARTDEAVNTFHANTAVITDFNDFRACLIKFLNHVETRVLRLSHHPDAAASFHWGRCVQLLLQEYGTHAEQTTFEIVRTGNEGGLYAVLKALAKRIAIQYAENEISARVWTYWNSLSVSEKLAASTEYIAKYGHLLPSELTEGHAARLREGLPKVLEQHPQLLRRLGRIGRD